METSAMKTFALALACAALAANSLLASGPWIDEAPPTLDVYLSRLPAKSLGQIFLETSSGFNTSGAVGAGEYEIQQIVDRIGKEPAKDLIASCERVLAEMRSAQFSITATSDYSFVDQINALHDLHDALITCPNDAADYMKWRLAHQDGWKSKPDDAPSELDQKPNIIAEVDKRIDSASGPILAHWYYLRGAIAFASDKEDAKKWFDRVVKEFPNDPRAEFAQFMSARCSLSLSRVEAWNDDHDAAKAQERLEERERARAGFQAVLDHNGRLAGDAMGWLGAVAWDSKDNLKALDYYIRQTELPGHPEQLKSAVFMTEKVLRRVAASPDGNAAFALIAKHPRVAMGMLYLVLGSPDAAGTITDSDGEDYPAGTTSKDLEKLKNWRKALLPRLADAVAAQKQVFEPAPWMSRYLALLAQAASEAGKQDEAIRLTDRLPEKSQNDDLLFAKAVAEMRAGNPKSAIATFQNLVARFPHSPLAPGVHIRLAMALRDNHQAGLALVQLQALVDQSNQRRGKTDTENTSDKTYDIYPPADSDLKFTDSAIYPDVSNAEMEQVKQQMDTLLNFAPIEELAIAAESQDVSPPVALDWRAVIAERALAHEDFTTAKRFMTPAQYSLIAANIEDLTSKAGAAADAKEKAELQMRLGDAWAASRGKLLMFPLDITATKETLFHEEPDLAEVNRRQNGTALGFHDLDAEIEARDELRHATRWWLDAARTLPGSPVSAAARLKVLEGLAHLATGSNYAFQRAVETHMPDVSRQIYDRLQKECPDSVEAKKAAYWDISGTAPDPHISDFGSEDQEDYRGREAGYLWPDFNAFGDFREEEYDSDGDGLTALRNPPGNLTELKKTVASLLEKARKANTAPPVTNCLEDISFFLSESGITAEMARDYINLRLDVTSCSFGLAFEFKVEGVPPEKDVDAEVRGRIAKALADSRMKNVRDYLEFLDAAVVANHQISVETPDKDKGEPFSYLSRDYPALEKMTRSFLQRYPHSKKREAARLLLARAVFKQSWPWIERLGSISPRGYGIFPTDFTTKTYQREAFDPKRVLAELDAYDKEFPHGRYAADIRSMRADTLWRMGDWKPALDLALDQLDNATPDLKQAAALRLANIFAELSNPDHRPAMLSILQDNARAKEYLGKYLGVAEGNREHPLALLCGYLKDKLGVVPVPPKAN